MGSQHYLPWKRSELETLLRGIIVEGCEGSKIDFKKVLDISQKEDKVELCLDLSSIANTDDEYYEDYGFIIIGTERGKIIGKCTGDSLVSEDHLQNDLEQVVREYLAPIPLFFVYLYNDPDWGQWGAIVVPPSTRQPHVFIKAFMGKAARGDWFVRVGTHKEKARAEDIAHILEKVVTIATGQLEEDINSLSARLSSLEKSSHISAFADLPKVTIQSLIDAVTPNSNEVGIAPEVELSARFRTYLQKPAGQLGDTLVSKAVELRRDIYLPSQVCPWALGGVDTEQAKNCLEYIELRSRPFVQTLATVVMYDDDSVFDSSLLQSISQLAKMPRAPNQAAHLVDDYGKLIRLYPLYLSIYTLFILGVERGRYKLLRSVLELEFEDDIGLGERPLAYGLAYFQGTGSIFNIADRQNLMEPIGNRVRRVLMGPTGWISEFVGFQDEKALFYRGEFVLSLAGLAAQRLAKLQEVLMTPLLAQFMVYYEAISYVNSFLQNPPNWLPELFKPFSFEQVLNNFDRASSRMLWSGPANGFRGGAVSAYKKGLVNVGEAANTE